jgi:hypothetical protein
MGDIAEMMIEAEMAGIDYESYCYNLAMAEIERQKKAAKNKKKTSEYGTNTERRKGKGK